MGKAGNAVRKAWGLAGSQFAEGAGGALAALLGASSAGEGGELHPSHHTKIRCCSWGTHRRESA